MLHSPGGFIPVLTDGKSYAMLGEVNPGRIQVATELTQELAWRAKQMYEEKDANGRRIWSMAKLAKELGCSETSVYRAVNGLGKFAVKQLPVSRSKEEMDAAAEASWVKFQALQKEEAANGGVPVRKSSTIPVPEAVKAQVDFLYGRGGDKAPERLPELKERDPKTIPPSLLDGGDGGEDETGGSGLSKLTAVIAEETGSNQMLNELKGGKE